MSKAILEALGVEDEITGLRAIAESTNLINEVRGAVDKATFGETLVAVRQNAALAKAVADATGKPAAEAVGVILAWKQAHDQHAQLEADLAEARAAVEKRDRAELIEQGKRDRKLTPASATFWEDKPVEQLRAFLESAPRIIPQPIEQPKDGEAKSPNVKAFEDMSPMERHAYRDEFGDDAYEALRADAAARHNGVVPPPALSDNYAG